MNAKVRHFLTAGGLLTGKDILSALVVAVAITGLFSLQSAVANEAAIGHKFKKRLYLGLNGGISHLDPVSRTTALDVGDNQDAGGSIFLGLDLSPRFSVEGYYADLGESRIDFLGDDVDGIEYQVYGLSLLGYVFNTREQGLEQREGFSGYLRAGIGGMNNDSTVVDYERDHDVHFSAGVGVEYGFRNGFGLRTELSSYDTDAQYLNIGLLKRFGSSSRGGPLTTDDTTTVANTTPVDNQPKSVIEAVVPVADANDFPKAYFAFDRYDLSDVARSRLDVVADALQQDESIQLIVEGHADAYGSLDYNDALSISRAAAARDYLIDKGVDRNRLSIVGYGETRPADTNDTALGRTMNRRVEFTLQ